MPITAAPRVLPAPTLSSSRSSHRTPPQERRIRASAEASSAPDRAVVILPGLGNNAADYAALAAQLRAQHRLHTEVAPVARVDWARNAAGLLDGAYWAGTLTPRPTVDWYLERTAAAVAAARAAAPGAPLTLLAHSAGGWLGRLFMLDYGTADLGIDRFVSLGSPHQPPPPGVVDQTRGILTWISANCPGAHHDDVQYVTVAGKWVQGAALAGPGSWQRRVVGQGYKQVCGEAEVWGDGVVPVPAAHLEKAVQVTLEGVYHSPLGAEEGGEVGAALAARSTAGAESDDGETDEYEATPADVEAAAAAAAATRPGPRLWYGSPPVLDRWVGLLRDSSGLPVTE